MRGCAEALVREGVNVVITARGAQALEETAAALRQLNAGVKVVAVAGDITTPEGRAAALAAAPQVDILINNAGGPPPGDFRNWDRDTWLKAIDANMLTPIELIKATVDGMAARGFGRIVNVASLAALVPGAAGATLAAQTGMVGPMSTILMGVFILHEPFTPWIALGTVLVIAGVWLLARWR
jgi:3-oxoacyl-[acyl-carrier protein] reductase